MTKDKIQRLASESIMLTGEPTAVFRHIVGMIADLFEVPVVCLAEISGPDLLFRALYVNGQTVTDSSSCSLAVTPCCMVESDRDIKIFDHVQELFPQATFLQEHNVRSYCGFPSVDDSGRVVAVTCLLDDKPRSFSEDDLAILRMLGQRIAVELVFSHVIAARETSDQELRTVEARLRRAQNMAHIGNWEMDFRSNRLIWSEEIFRIFERDPAQFVPTYEAFLDTVHPQDRKQVDSAYRQSLEDRLPYHITHRLLMRDGRIKYVEESCETDFAPDGSPILSLGTVQDVTQRVVAMKQLQDEREIKATLETLVAERTAELVAQERSFRTTFENAAVGIAHVGLDGRFLRFNGKLCEIIGYSPAELADKTFQDITHPDDLAADMAQATRLFSGEIASYAVEKRYIRKDGSVVWIELHGATVHSTSGEIEFAVAIVSDISERILIQRALNDSEHRHRSLLANLKGMAYRSRNEPNWPTDFASDGSLQLLGLAPEELTSGHRTIASLIHPEDLPALNAAFQSALTTREPLDEEYRLILPDGQIKWVWNSGQWTVGADGQVVSNEGFIVDITERKQMEENLAASQKFMQNLLNTLTSHIAVLDETGCIIASNRAWTQFAEDNGLPATQVGIGVNYLAACEQAAAEPSAAEAAMLLRKLTTGEGNSGSFVYPCHSPTEERWFVCQTTRFNDGGSFRVVVAHENITSFKQAQRHAELLQRQFHDLFEFAPDAMLMSDSAGYIILANQQAERLFGYSRAELIGQPVELLMPPTLHSDHVRWRAQYFANSAPRMMGAGSTNLKSLRKDGTSIPVDISLGSLEVNGDKVVVVAIRDMSERKKADDAILALNADLERRINERTAQLETARAVAEAANRAKSEFLATMSHEIRTPLNAIVGTAELLAHSPDHNDQTRMLWVMQESANALTGIIDDVLDMSKIEAGMLEIHRVPVSVRDIVASAVEIFASRASAKNLYLRTAIDERIPTALNTDPLRLRQILFNLLGNAIKFTSAGGVEIRLVLQEDALPGAVIRVEVADTGMGISPEAQTRLFQPFAQAEADTTRKFGGTGLGLVISRRLAELLGGSLTLNSVQGQGTTMALTLALDLAQATDRSNPFSPATLPAQSAATNRKVLLVDDNSINRVVLNRQLKILGYHADQAQDGREALRMWRSGDYELLITDCHMPDMDGYELARSIRESEAQQPLRDRLLIIAYTANAMQDSRDRCVAAGMNDLLIKPVGLQALSAKLGLWLGAAPTLEPGTADDLPESEMALVTSPIDWETMDEITGGDDIFGREILRDFLVEKSTEMQCLVALLTDGNSAEIERLAHRMKGAARTVAAAPLAAVCERIELAVGNADKQALPAIRLDLEREFARLKMCIEQRSEG